MSQLHGDNYLGRTCLSFHSVFPKIRSETLLQASCQHPVLVHNFVILGDCPLDFDCANVSSFGVLLSLSVAT